MMIRMLLYKSIDIREYCLERYDLNKRRKININIIIQQCVDLEEEEERYKTYV